MAPRRREGLVAERTALIIGAGPAGLTAAYELVTRTGVRPVVLEMTGDLGGLSKTVNYRGNRIDIGGHRFFSKSDRVMAWWQHMLPLQGAPAWDDRLLGRSLPLSTAADAPDPETSDAVLLVRRRVSRILYSRKFFDYPISLSPSTARKLGLARLSKIGMSYGRARLLPIRHERTLEDFLINRFGRELYETFFRDYTEKVWGVPCNQISKEWGAQRIKGLSISGAIAHALRRSFRRGHDLSQKGTETTLIEQFLYPKFGPGQMWEEVARRVVNAGGRVELGQQVVGAEVADTRVVSVVVKDQATGTLRTVTADYFISTMAIDELIAGMRSAPEDVKSVAAGLVFRDFVTVGLLVRALRIANETSMKTVNGIIPDNWIYVQEPDVRLGRIQVFNNWSPYLVSDRTRVWLGLEYFGNHTDGHWAQSDSSWIAMAIEELARIGVIHPGEVMDGVVIRMPKTYPAYFGSYSRFPVVREYLDRFQNLFLVGRNGMHRYNNQDHSMLTAMAAVENISRGVASKDNIWQVNTDEEYHEERGSS